MIKDPTLTAADLVIVADRLANLRELALKYGTAVTDRDRDLDVDALTSAIAAVTALAVDCDASISSKTYIEYGERAAHFARLFAERRDA